MKKINFLITTPSGIVYDASIDSVTIDTVAGQLTILPNHTPIIVPLKSGEVLVRNGSEEVYLSIFGGFLEVQKDSKVNIVADEAVHVDDIDEEKVKAAIARAEELKKQKLDKASEEYARLAAVLEKEMAKLRLLRKKRR